jgi:hypothetical protein
LLPGVVRLLLDHQRGNLPAVAADARDLQAMAEVADAAQPGLGADLSALALIRGLAQLVPAGRVLAIQLNRQPKQLLKVRKVRPEVADRMLIARPGAGDPSSTSS